MNIKYAIVKEGALLTEPHVNTREAKIGEQRVRCLFSRQVKNPVLFKETSYEMVSLADDKAIFKMQHTTTTLEEAKEAAKKLLGEESQKRREAGFVSSVTGQWSGVLSKDNILRAEPIAKSARSAVAEGRPSVIRSYKLATNNSFIELTNAQMVAIDDEVNGDTGFIQRCYNREAKISALIDAVTTTPETVDEVYNTEVNIGWPS